jgi:L-threonylcarbamoyladenylate synthase
MKTEVVAAIVDRGCRSGSDPGSTTPATGRAVDLLRKGEVVALPTETVYGLAGDALNPIAVAKIFEAKERPRFDPLIVHLPEYDWLERVAIVPAPERQFVDQLIQNFWPGPLTFVLPKSECVPDLITAGLATVAIRISAHPVFSDVAKVFGKPLAAPSANRFGRISPTTAQNVLEELAGRIPLIVDAGPTEHGIESTIIAIGDGKIRVLRRGPITLEQLSEFGEVEVISDRSIGYQPMKSVRQRHSDKTNRSHRQAADATIISAPGQLPSHYAPRTALRLVDDADEFTPEAGQRVALLAWKRRKKDDRFLAVRQLSDSQDLREAAANLFRYLRELDQIGADLIVAERVPEFGLGGAILDRLRRASSGSRLGS